MHLVLKTPPISTNKLTRAIKRGNFCTVIKSADARKFEADVRLELESKYMTEMDKFFTEFDISKQIKLSVTFNVPNLYTKKGVISKSSGDLDNYLKQYIDTIFKCLCLDDKFVTEIHAKKLYNKEFKSEFLIEVI